MGFIAWARTVIDRLLRKDAKDIFKTDVSLSSAMETAIATFYNITSGNPPWKDQEDEVDTINFAGYIDDVTAGLATLDLDIQIDGHGRAELLKEQADYVLKVISDKVSEGLGNAGIMFKPNGENIDYVKAGNFAPTAADSNGDIKGCVFRTILDRNGYRYTRYEWQRYEGELYRITNVAYKKRIGSTGVATGIGRPCDLAEVEEWAAIEPDVYIANVEKPLFALFKNPAPNRIDRDSALGVPIWGNCIKELKDLDIAWSRKGTETEDSKHVTYLPYSAIRYAKDNKVKLPRTLKGVEMGVGVNDENMIHEHVATLLTEQRIKDINSILAMISTKCGFSQGFFQLDEKTGMMTATQVEADDQETIRTIKNIRDTLKECIKQLLYGCNVMADLYSDTPPELWENLEESMAFNFGDITYNYQEDAANWWKYRIQGDVPAWMYYVKFEGMSEDEARQMIEEAKKENEPEEPDLFSKE